MQIAAIEFARDVLKMGVANTTEVKPRTKHPVIHIMPQQKEYLKRRQYGGTIRLGAWPCTIRKGTLLEKAYKKYGGGRSNPWFVPNPIAKHQSPISKFRSLIFERHNTAKCQ